MLIDEPVTARDSSLQAKLDKEKRELQNLNKSLKRHAISLSPLKSQTICGPGLKNSNECIVPLSQQLPGASCFNFRGTTMGTVLNITHIFKGNVIMANRHQCQVLCRMRVLRSALSTCSSIPVSYL
ncbi:MAG: hypothetical protein MHMPM18_004716 [Marteilia pararefringens]